jgi:hypothetical protein
MTIKRWTVAMVEARLAAKVASRLREEALPGVAPGLPGGIPASTVLLERRGHEPGNRTPTVHREW